MPSEFVDSVDLDGFGQVEMEKLQEEVKDLEKQVPVGSPEIHGGFSIKMVPG